MDFVKLIVNNDGAAVCGSFVANIWDPLDAVLTVASIAIFTFMGIRYLDINQQVLGFQVYGGIYFAFAALCVLGFIIRHSRHRSNWWARLFYWAVFVLRTGQLVYVAVLYWGLIKDFGPIIMPGGSVIWYTLRSETTCYALDGIDHEDIVPAHWHKIQVPLDSETLEICGKTEVSLALLAAPVSTLVATSDIHFRDLARALVDAPHNLGTIYLVAGDLSNEGAAWEYWRTLGTWPATRRIEIANGNHDVFRKLPSEWIGGQQRLRSTVINAVNGSVQFLTLNFFMNDDLMEMPNDVVSNVLQMARESIADTGADQVILTSHYPIYTGDFIKEDLRYTRLMEGLLDEFEQIKYVFGGHSHYAAEWDRVSPVHGNTQYIYMPGTAVVSSDLDPEAFMQKLPSLGEEWLQWNSTNVKATVIDMATGEVTFLNRD